MPAALTLPDFDTQAEELECNFLYFDRYFAYLNNLKAACPDKVVANYFDVGLTVSLVSAHVARSGIGLLIEDDNLSTMNEGSIGHTMSKMVQLTKITSYRQKQGVYNFYIGDGHVGSTVALS